MSAALLSLNLLAASSQSIEFLGFSRNEAIAAYRVAIHHERDGGLADRYALVCVISMEQGDVAAVFRDSSIERVDARGKRVSVARSLLLEDNPLYAEAEAAESWRRLRARAGLRSRKLPMDESIVRLQPHNDVRLAAEAKKDAIELSAETGSPVGFTTVIRSVDADHRAGRSYRVEGAPGERISGRVTAYHSPSGYSVAVLAEFTVGGATKLSQIGVHRLEESPVGTYRIGTHTLALENLRMGEAYFKNVHPESRGDFDRFVGTYWNSP